MIKGLPQRLKEIRIKNNLSQKVVAKRLDLSPSIISSYETGERTPSLETFLALSKLYKCTTDYLLGKESTQQPIFLDIASLNQEQRDAVISLVKSIKK